MKQNSTIYFTPLSSDSPIEEIIKEAFDMSLDISGSWGYGHDTPILIHTYSTPLTQLQHTIASMRTHLEMSMTLETNQRYGGINLNEISRETIGKLEKVTYIVTAMLESNYTKFISEYKKGYGTDEFDMEAHFKARKDATISREIYVWFQIDK